MKKSQKGVALLTALFVVVLTTIVAVAMTTRQQLDIRRTANVLNRDQAYLYALGAENWARRILVRDGKNGTVDYLYDIWATQLPPMMIPGGSLQGQITDLQGRFNVNNLVINGEVDIEAMAYFTRLLKALELPETLVQVAIDWIDRDQTPQTPYGAEDNTYLLNTPAYRTADLPFKNPSELRLLTGIEWENYQKLLPHITTLPTQTAINVNTATDFVLMALAEGITLADVEILQKAREDSPFESVQDFLVHEALAGIEVKTENISVASDYFLVTASVEIEQAQIQLTSVLYRQADQVKVILRSQNVNF